MKNKIFACLVFVLGVVSLFAQSDDPDLTGNLDRTLIERDYGTDGELYGEVIPGLFNRKVDNQLAVGRIPGVHGVSATGAANYAIPIPLPPGTAGMVPSLKITYSSQGGDGPLGIGWNIDATSMIHRTGKDLMHDFRNEPINWDNFDNIALDGNRLKLISGSHFSSGAEYGQEVEDFSRIYLSGSEGDYCFKRWTKTGLIYTYGCSSVARKTNAQGVTFAWLLEKVADQAGNYYVYGYDFHNGEQVLSSIEYTGNQNASPAQNPYWEVKFEYMNRTTDPNERFIKGMSVKSGALLRRIKVVEKTSGNTVKTYRLQYNMKHSRTLLRQITQVGRDGGALNSTVVTYGERSPKLEYSNADASLLSNGSITTADVHNYDNIFLAGRFGNASNNVVNNLVSFHRASGSTAPWHEYDRLTVYSYNGGSLSVTREVNLPSVYHIDDENKLKPFNTFDYNGDGIDDIVMQKVQGTGLDEIHIVYGPLSTADFQNPLVLTNPVGGALLQSNTERQFLPADFNGDGKMDFISVQRFVGPLNGIPFITINETSVFFEQVDLGGLDWEDAQHMMILDFNGDGRSDVLVTQGGNTRIYSYKVDAQGNVQSELLYSSGFPDSNHDVVIPGDYNGDGLTDLLTHKSGNWNVSYSTGVGFHTVSMPQNVASNKLDANTQNSRILSADINGDGLVDIIEFKNVMGAISSTVTEYRSTGKSFEQITHESSVFPPMDASYDPIFNLAVNWPVFDFTQDGRVDFMMQNARSGKFFSLVRADYTRDAYRATSIVDGYGYFIGFHYKTINTTTEYYQNPESYPLLRIGLPVTVVDEVYVPDGINESSIFFPVNPFQPTYKITTTYNYKYATYHMTGRGFLGLPRYHLTHL